jgi:hypothetical protein
MSGISPQPNEFFFGLRFFNKTPSSGRFADLLPAFQARFDLNISGDAHLFRTSTGKLFDAFLEALPAERQQHNCNCCRHFIGRYGGLVTIDQDGETHSVFWNADDFPDFYKLASDCLRNLLPRW